MSWEWTDDANRQPMALEHEELTEVITTWSMLSADLRRQTSGHLLDAFVEDRGALLPVDLQMHS